MKDIPVGIVGLGYWGPNLLRNFASTPGCTVSYGCDLDRKNLDKIERTYPSVTLTQRYDELLSDSKLELIVIATPTSTHFELAKKALESGKHVLIEKPMTRTTKEASELNRIAHAMGKHIFVDHTFLFTPSVQKLCQWVIAGDIGELMYFDSSRINLGIIQKDANVFQDLAVHDLSILSGFKNLDDIVDIRAQGNSYYGDQTEVGHLHLEFNDGFHAHIHVSWLSPVKIRHTIVAGKTGMITYDDTEPSEKLRLYDKGVDHDASKPDPFFPKYRSGDILIPALPSTEALGIQAAHVVACLHDKEKPKVNGEEGRKVVEVLEKANQILLQA